jgi:probable rRNA maturation factor
MSIQLTVERGPHEGVQRGAVLRAMRAVVDLLQLQDQEISIVLTDDSQIQKLNALYRGKDRPTDVLAFAQREGEFSAYSGPLLGDIIVSIPTARRQAEARSKPVFDEVVMLLSHGLLHLLGWDHDTREKDRRMRAETDRLCQAAFAGRSSVAVGAERRRPSPKGRPSPAPAPRRPAKKSKRSSRRR